MTFEAEDAVEAEVDTAPLLCFYFSSLHLSTPSGLHVLIRPNSVLSSSSAGFLGLQQSNYFPQSSAWSRTFLNTVECMAAMHMM